MPGGWVLGNFQGLSLLGRDSRGRTLWSLTTLGLPELVLRDLDPVTSPRGRYHHPYLTNKEPETQGGQVSPPRD